MNKYLVLNPSYGYLTSEHEYKGFNVETAGLFSEDEINANNFNSDDFVLTPMTESQINNLPFDLSDTNNQDTEFEDGLSDMANTMIL